MLMSLFSFILFFKQADEGWHLLTFCVTTDAFLLKCATQNFFPEPGLKMSLHKPFH